MGGVVRIDEYGYVCSIINTCTYFVYALPFPLLGPEFVDGNDPKLWLHTTTMANFHTSIDAPRLSPLRREFKVGDKVFYFERWPHLIHVFPVITKCVRRRVGVVTSVNVKFEWCNINHNSDQFVPFDCLHVVGYEDLHATCKRSIYAWLCLSKQLTFLPRDMRRLIGQYVWKTRDDREWE